MRTRRIRPAPRGGCTESVRTRDGFSSSSASLIQRSPTAWSSAMRAFSRSVSHSLVGGVARSKSSRERSAPICPPVTPAPGIRLHSRCSAVCIRMWRWRGVQSSTAVTVAPTGGSVAPSAARCRTVSASPFTALVHGHLAAIPAQPAGIARLAAGLGVKGCAGPAARLRPGGQHGRCRPRAGRRRRDREALSASRPFLSQPRPVMPQPPEAHHRRRIHDKVGIEHGEGLLGRHHQHAGILVLVGSPCSPAAPGSGKRTRAA